ncbi:MAG TPA: MFS transporter [Gaiellaceae bacterium]|nr:MFS transporter [Gaiellaceae bacterium]
MTGVRTLVPRLPRGAWLLLGGDALSAVGSGLTLPFLLVYLHQVRGIGLDLAGLALATVAAAGLVGNPVGGALGDRIGPRRTLALGLVLAAAGTASLAAVHSASHAFAAAALYGLGSAIAWPAQDALLATLVPPEQRSAAFSVRHATLNAGLGAGAVTAALAVSLASPSALPALFVLDALSTLAFVPLALRLRGRAPSVDKGPADATERGGYREVLADRAFRRVLAVSALLVTAGYAQYHAAFPAYATGPGGLSPGVLGVAFAVNTFAVVTAQLVVLRLLGGRRRTHGIALVGVAWAGSWAIALAAGGLGGGLAGAVAFGMVMVLFAIGETLLSPTLPALVNDLAPDYLRGRYNGASAVSWSGGFLAGPALTGVAFSAGLANGLLLGFVGACSLAAAMALRLERRLPRQVNVVPGPERNRRAGAALVAAEVPA